MDDCIEASDGVNVLVLHINVYNMGVRVCVVFAQGESNILEWCSWGSHFPSK
jgi:hypothetical protein